MKASSSWALHCINCRKELSLETSNFICPNCSNLLELSLLRPKPGKDDLFPVPGQIHVWRYRSALPFGDDLDPVTLGEGGTPLIKSVQIGPAHGLRNLYFKNEGQNPTGSFKDRGMTVAVTKARGSGAKVLICASTGNTSASLAAYASRAKMKSAVIVPSGNVAAGKLAQAFAYGATVVRVDGDFDKALRLTLEAVSKRRELYLMNSVNPYRLEGQKTAAYEIYEQFRGVPDFVVLPVGNAGNISALWKGFKELKSWGIADSVPRMVGVQAEGAAPIAEAFAEGRDSVRTWKSPETVASAIRIGNPVSWKKALVAIRESGGFSLSVTDQEILGAGKALASEEGIFVEAASAAPIAALRHIKDRAGPRSSVVCVATGNGLKEQGAYGPDLSRTPTFSDAESLIHALL